MRWRMNLALLVVASLLTVWVLVFEEDRTVFEPAGKVFPRLEPSDFVELELSVRASEVSSGQPEPPIRLEKRGEYEWWLVEPIEYPGLLPRVQGLIWEIVDMVQVATVAPDSPAFSDAIAPEGPRLSVRFRTSEGAEHRFEIGRDYPDERLDYLYLRVDGEQVHVTRKKLLQNLNVRVRDLRQRALFPIAPPDALRLAVEGPPGELRFAVARESTSAPWVFEGDPDLESTRVDRELLEAVLGEVNAWRVDGFVDDTGEDLAEYGLESPRYRIRARHARGFEIELDVGRRFEEGGVPFVYVTRTGRVGVVRAEEGPISWLETGPEELRTRHVFDFASAEAREVVATGKGRRLRLVRRAVSDEDRERGRVRTSDDEVWLVGGADGSDEWVADRPLVGRAIAELREMLIQEFLPRAEGPPAPEEFPVRVELELDDGRRLTLYIGEHSDAERDRDFEVYTAARSTDPSRFLVETDWPRRLELGPFVFRDREISSLDPRAVFEVEVSAGDESWWLGRIPREDWSLRTTRPLREGRELDQTLIHEVVRGLGERTFRVREFVPDLPPERYESVGIGRRVHRLSVRLGNVEGDYSGFRRLWIGERADTERAPDGGPELYYARTDTTSSPFLLEAELPDGVERLVDHLRDVTRVE